MPHEEHDRQSRFPQQEQQQETQSSMAFEKPPPGYRKMDRPLPHNFRHSFMLDALTANKASTYINLMKSTLDSVAPSTIEVHPQNSGFAVETGCVCCLDSKVQRMMHRMDFTVTKHFLGNFVAGGGNSAGDYLNAIKINYMPVAFAFEDSMTVADTDSGQTIADILELTVEGTTNEDVTPTYANLKLAGGIAIPLSTVTTPNAEVFGDWNLDTDTTNENIVFDKEQFYDALQFFTNGKILSAVTGKMRTILLTKNNTHKTVFWNRTIPSNIRRINPFLYFGVLIHVEKDGDQTFLSTEATAGNHVLVRTQTRYNEWNTEFNQSRM